MKLDFNIQLNQKQGLALTAQVQQAIKLLHMTNLEIQEFVHDQFQDNPLLKPMLVQNKMIVRKRPLPRILMWINPFKKIPMLNKKRKQKSLSKINLKPGKVIFQNQRSPKLTQTSTP